MSDPTTPPGDVSARTTLRLTLDDMLAASRLHHKLSLTSRRILTVVAAAAVAAFGIGYAITQPGDAPLLIGAIGAVGAVVYLGVVFLIFRVAVLPLSVRRIFREQKNLHEDHVLAWDERRYTVVAPSTRSDIAWDSYLKWRENDRVLLLYVSSRLYQILPKRVLTEQAVAEIREHLVRAGAGKGGPAGR